MSQNEFLRVPVRGPHANEKWGALAFLVTATQAIDFVGENIRLVEENFSFFGGHRVRRYRAKKSVHFAIAPGMMPQTLDIDAVPPAAAPPRRPQGR